MNLNELKSILSFISAGVAETERVIRRDLQDGLPIPRSWYIQLLEELRMVRSVKRSLITQYGDQGRFIASLY